MKRLLFSAAAVVATAAAVFVVGCQQEALNITPNSESVAAKAKASSTKTKTGFSTLTTCSPLMVLKCAGNANDASGNGYNASVLGSPTPTYSISSYPGCASSGVNGIVNFNQTGANCWYVPTSNTMSWGSGDFTVHVKFKIDALNGTQQTIFMKKDINTSIAAHAIELRVNTSNKLSLFFRETTSSTSVTIDAASTTLSTGTWYCATVTRTGSTVTMYLNGTSVATGTYAGSLSSNGAIRISSNRDNNTGDTAGVLFPFKGSVDQVVVWNCSSTASEASTYCYDVFVDCN